MPDLSHKIFVNLTLKRILNRSLVEQQTPIFISKVKNYKSQFVDLLLYKDSIFEPANNKLHKIDNNIQIYFCPFTKQMEVQRGNQFFCYQMENFEQFQKWRNLLKLKVRQLMFDEHYEVVRILGKGSFAKVYLAKKALEDEQGEVQYAVKVITKGTQWNNAQKYSVRKQIKIMKTAQHKNLLKLEEVFEDSAKVYIVSEFLSGGQLFCNNSQILHTALFLEKNKRSRQNSKLKSSKKIQQIKNNKQQTGLHNDLILDVTVSANKKKSPKNSPIKRGPVIEIKKYSPCEIKQIMFSILNGLAQLHSHGIMHRDLKPQNILFREQGSFQCVICDFGLAEFQNSQNYLYRGCGTPGYIAPQIIQQPHDIQKQKYTTACDIYSLGLIFYTLIFDRSIFADQNQKKIIKNNRSCNIDFNSDNFKSLDKITYSLLTSMLVKKPINRITAEKALSHDYFKKRVITESQQSINYAQICYFDEQEDNKHLNRFVSNQNNTDTFLNVSGKQNENPYLLIQKPRVSQFSVKRPK